VLLRRLWVGREVRSRTRGAFAADVLGALREMPTPMLRWPGGCYADHYHWRDGIGPERPRRLGMSCGAQVEDDNALGTHEFLEPVRADRCGARTLPGNVGSGSPQEMADWIEYVNSGPRHDAHAERRANGRAEPWRGAAVGGWKRELGLRRELRCAQLWARVPPVRDDHRRRGSHHRAGHLWARGGLEHRADAHPPRPPLARAAPVDPPLLEPRRPRRGVR
jgi:hypothetical protein